MQIARARHRIAAYLFDCAIVYSISILILARPLVLLIKTLNSTTSIDVINLFINSIVSGGIVLIFIIFYCVIIPYLFKGQTIGKKFFRIKIVKIDGSNVSLGTLFVREIIGKILVDFICLGTAVIADGFVLVNSENHLTFYDVLASTMVVDVV